jgi:uncharacterized membrane protein (DUF2068 family)
MKRSTNIVIATVLVTLYALQNVVRAATALATQSQVVQDNGYGFVTIMLVIWTVCLVSAFGVWQNQKWGKVLAILTLGLNALPALAGIMTGDTTSSKLFLGVDVLVAIVVTILLLSRSKEASAA